MHRTVVFLPRSAVLSTRVLIGFWLGVVVLLRQGRDMVLANGRVMDPGSGLDVVRNISNQRQTHRSHHERAAYRW